MINENKNVEVIFPPSDFSEVKPSESIPEKTENTALAEVGDVEQPSAVSAVTENSDCAKVSVILIIGNCKKTDNISAWVSQTYKNTEIFACGISDDKDVENNLLIFTKLCRNFSFVKVAKEDSFSVVKSILECADKLTGDYVIVADVSDFYPTNYIEKMIEAGGSRDIITSEVLTVYPADIDDFKLQGFKFYENAESDAPYADFIKKGGFWGYYFLGCKLVKSDVFRNAAKNISDAALANIRTASYPMIEHLLVSNFLFKNAGSFIASSASNMVFNWDSEDTAVKQIINEFNLVLRSINKVFACMNDTVSGASIPSFEFKKLIKHFAQRMWWRIAWLYNNEEKENVINCIKDTVGADDLVLSKNDPEFNITYPKNDVNIDLYKSENDLENIELPKNEMHIYVSMHKESYVPDIDCLKPIQVGASIAADRFHGMLHDDEGDNISDKNKRYCELTAQYWAWKNDKDADVYGFWHYRRYFCFNNALKADMWGNVDIPKLDKNALSRLQINENTINAMSEIYDIIIPESWTCNEGDGVMTVYQHWCRHFAESDIQTLADVINEKYPEYTKPLMKLLFSDSAPFCNLFIMKKDMFNKYCEFCFSVLEEVEKRVDHSTYNVERYRTMGHLAERLVGVFVNYIEAIEPDKKILRVPTVLIRDTRPRAIIRPLETNKKSVALTIACNDKFVPYTAVLLQSIVENSSDEFFYDIILMHRDITIVNQNILKSIVGRYSNFSLRIADVTKNFEKYNSLHIDRHLSLETYFRFMILDIMPEYEKVLYIDCDMVVEKDIAELYFSDIEGYAVAATRDLDFIAAYQDPAKKVLYDEKIMKYLDMKDPAEYFQAGVILFNMKEISKIYTVEDLFDKANSRSWYYHDQDVLNSLFNGRVKYLDQKWNVMTLLEPGSQRELLIKNHLYARFVDEYEKARGEMGIIHFAGIPKPWINTKCDLAQYFWKYARKSPFYETLISNLNQDYMLPFGSVIFYDKHEYGENVGAALFEINLVNEPWSENYIVIDFIFLSEHERREIVKSSLFISVSCLYSEEGNYLKVNKFDFDNCDFDYILKDNIGFRIKDEKTIIVYGRQTQQYEGYSWRVRELTSREYAKPTVKALNEGFIWKSESVKNMTLGKDLLNDISKSNDERKTVPD